MAWTAPSTFVAGAILTAAQLNTNVRDNTLAGGPIYATEAARDAAITSPFEGQRAYITGSTVAAATGLVTAVPTGIQCIHNGSSTPTLAANWVCVTPVGADTSTSGTTSLTGYTATLASGGANPSVTLSTGTTAQVMFGANITMAGTTSEVLVSVAVSGATTLAASDAFSASYAVAVSGYDVSVSRMIILTGLTAGVNTFTLNYRSANGAIPGTFKKRSIVVQGIA